MGANNTNNSNNKETNRRRKWRNLLIDFNATAAFFGSSSSSANNENNINNKVSLSSQLKSEQSLRRQSESFVQNHQPLPHIKCTNKQRRLPPLSISEYIDTYQDIPFDNHDLPNHYHQHYHNNHHLNHNNHHSYHNNSSYYVDSFYNNNPLNNHSRQHNRQDYQIDSQKLSMDIDLITRIFRGSMDSNLLRTVLWPIIFNLVEYRDKIVFHNDKYIVIPHECNIERWQDLTKKFHLYLHQWKSITPEQECRFAMFRERKSSIERDVIRCDRLHPFYKDNPDNLETLTTLLMTYMIYDFDIGYVQGMLDLAAPILFVFNGDIVKAFWIFNEVMKLFRRNFEQSQKTIHFQLVCLYRLIKHTDGDFARYLNERDSSNCFFAFRCFVCQFKREIMKESEDDYSNVLYLWDTIWCVQRLSQLRAQQQKQYCDNNNCVAAINIPRTQIQQVISSSDATTTTTATAAITCNNMTNGHVQISSTVIQVMNGNHFCELSCCLNGVINMASPLHNEASRAINSSASLVSDEITNNSSDWTLDDKVGITGSTDRDTVSSCKRTESTKSQTSLPDSLTLNTVHDDDDDDRYHRNSLSTNRQIDNNNINSKTMNHDCQQTNNNINSNQEKASSKQSFHTSYDQTQADLPRFSLSETEKFVLALCLSLIRRERDLIMHSKLDATEILQHFIDPKLCDNLENFIQQATNIYSYLKEDFDIDKLFEEDKSPNQNNNNNNNNNNNQTTITTNNVNCTIDEGYDFLSDYLIINDIPED